MSDSVGSRVGGGLGPNQIAWLRANVPAFEDAWKAVKASDAHAARIRAKLEARVKEAEETSLS
ncbi:MAG TPA: hypothetical protein VMH36_21440 [Alphaproteobacteria bacterium]|jgi:hypothetical protein|nr:hypothetical protein [Alphaproteobacteria bacterium]